MLIFSGLVASVFKIAHAKFEHSRLSSLGENRLCQASSLGGSLEEASRVGFTLRAL